MGKNNRLGARQLLGIYPGYTQLIPSTNYVATFNIYLFSENK